MFRTFFTTATILFININTILLISRSYYFDQLFGVLDIHYNGFYAKTLLSVMVGGCNFNMHMDSTLYYEESYQIYIIYMYGTVIKI